MKRLSLVFMVCLLFCGVLPVDAQTKRTIKKTSTTAVEKSEAEVTGPVVIAVEDGKVYTDPLPEPVVPGDRLVVYKCNSYFTHPVTKERIQRGMQDIAELEVERVFATYLQAIPKPLMVISQIKPAVMIRKSEKVQEPATPVTESPYVDEQQEKEQRVLDAITTINKQLPSEKKNNQLLMDITVDGKTIYYNHLVTSKNLYILIKKSIQKDKFYKDKTLRDIRSSEIYMLAKNAGFMIVDRWWNKDKSEYIDYTLLL